MSSATILELMGELGSPAGQADPYPVYERLRAMGDVVSGPDDALLVTGHRQCAALLRDNRLRKSPGRLLVAAGFPDWIERPALRMMFTSLLMINPPEHTRLRALVSREFTARRVSALRRPITAIAEELLAPLTGEVDFIDTIAFPFPVTVIGELLGIPAADRPMFQGLVHDWSSVLEILNPPAVEGADAAATRIRAYLSELAAERRAAPRDDLISALAAVSTETADADADGDGALSDDELVTTAALILAAGFETTTGLLANGLLALLAHPAEADRLRHHPELAQSGVEELLRYDSPVQMIYGRSAVEEMTVGDLELHAGQRVITILGAGNRDPNVFEQPAELRLDRDEGGVLSFGAGIHHCLGAALARLEGQVMFPLLLERFPQLRLAGEPVHRPGIAIHSYMAMPVALA
ncbi:MAG TPA: cytochrome P450 [Solirubrobacteraceae bacterium]